MVHLPAEWWGREGERSPLSSREPLLKSTNHSIVVAQLALLSCQCKRRGHRDEWHTGWSQHLANHVGTLYQNSIITLGQLNLDKTYRLRTRRGKDSVQQVSGQKWRLLMSAMGADQFLCKLSPVKDLCNTTHKQILQSLTSISCTSPVPFSLIFYVSHCCTLLSGAPRGYLLSQDQGHLLSLMGGAGCWAFLRGNSHRGSTAAYNYLLFGWRQSDRGYGG